MRALKTGALAALTLAAAACGGDSDDARTMAANDPRAGEGATETNAETTRPVCENDADCPNGGPCLFADPDGDKGRCAGDDEAAAPIPCDAPDDCPPGASCGADGVCELPPTSDAASGGAAGTCLAGSQDCADLGPADGPGAPALCQSDAECGDGTCVIQPGDDTGLCAP